MLHLETVFIPAALRGVGEDFASSDGFAGDVAAERVVVVVVVEVAGVTTCRRLIPISSTSFSETIEEEEEEFVCCGGLMNKSEKMALKGLKTELKSRKLE